MKKTLILLSILTSFVASAQSIEINPNGGTNASAVLDLKSTTKGFLLPRMTNAQMRAIPSPAQGLLAFCTDCGTNGDYYFYKGTDWVALGSTTVSVSTTMGSVSANADEKGATITTGGVLNLAPANATNPGIITATDQTFGGVKTFSNGIVGNVTGNVTGNLTGNAATVTTNANLTGVVTSTGNATSIANGAITNAMLANGAVANLSGTNTGDQTLPTLSSLGAVASNTVITGATNTKITYDAKGLVTAGAAATTADIAESADKKYVTDAQLTVISNTSGTNTGDNAVNSLYSGLVSNATHTGDVTGSTALTIANDAVTTAKIAAGAITDSKVTDVAASKITGILPVTNGGTGAITLTTNNVLLGNGTSTLQAVAPGANGNVLTSNGTTWTSAAATIPLPAGSTKGSIMYNNGSSWATLAPGAEGQFLKMSSSGIPVWGDAATSAVLAGTASSTPTLTVNTVLTNITHATLGATGIGTASNLPTGVFATWSGNVVTISGTPSTAGTFNYTIPLTGTGCTSLNAMGTITVNTTSATVTSSQVSNISYYSARAGGNISSDGGVPVTARGVVWSTSTEPTVSLTTKTSDGTGTGSFTSTISGLTTGTTYYVRAYATNSAGTSYGSELTFTTITFSPATVTSSQVSNISYFSASAGGNISSDGGAPVTARGVVWSTSTGPTVSLTTKTTDGTGTGSFTSTISGLTASTTYYVRAYATNYTGTSYGSELTFTTTSTCTLNTAGTPSTSPTLIVNTALTNITIATTGATGIGTVSGLPDGVTANWSGNVITISGTPTATGTFNYTILLTGGCGTVNAAGSITTVNATPATVTSSQVSNIYNFSASAGGNISSDGVTPILARGVVWSTSTEPTVSLTTKTSDGTGTGTFTSTISGLTASTTYYVRAYATNSAGTSYGSELTFTTLSTITGTVTDIDGNTYNTVQIGRQVWMSENLKTSRYRNGEPIEIVTDGSIWSNLTTGGRAWYDDDSTTYENPYGNLYNWYAVSDIRELCPTGWHVPSNTEWATLTGTNGEDNDQFSGVGPRLKSIGTDYWNAPNNGTNAYGFSGLPGGYKPLHGVGFQYIGNYGYWWSSTPIFTDGPNESKCIILGEEIMHLTRNNKYGFSVRCLMD